jgi:methionine-rich copper-binding protein CopC
MKRLLLMLLAAASAAAFVARADAHAFLDHATPAVGSAVHGSPTEIKLWFTQALEPAFCTVKVLDRNGRTVDVGDKAVDAADRTLLRVSLQPLPPGTYRVVWRVLSVDTHVTEGDFTFDVAP